MAFMIQSTQIQPSSGMVESPVRLIDSSENDFRLPGTLDRGLLQSPGDVDMKQFLPLENYRYSVTVRKLQIPKNTSSTNRRLRVALMASINQVDTKQCLAMTYSIPFFVHSNQIQLSTQSKIVRKELINRKERVIPATNWIQVQRKYLQLSQYHFFIANVAPEQVQERNVMGESERYPSLCFNLDFFTEELKPFQIKGLWLEFHLVESMGRSIYQCMTPSRMELRWYYSRLAPSQNPEFFPMRDETYVNLTCPMEQELEEPSSPEDQSMLLSSQEVGGEVVQDQRALFVSSYDLFYKELPREAIVGSGEVSSMYTDMVKD